MKRKWDYMRVSTLKRWHLSSDLNDKKEPPMWMLEEKVIWAKEQLVPRTWGQDKLDALKKWTNLIYSCCQMFSWATVTWRCHWIRCPRWFTQNGSQSVVAVSLQINWSSTWAPLPHMWPLRWHELLTVWWWGSNRGCPRPNAPKGRNQKVTWN